jgi:hypothetical protein
MLEVEKINSVLAVNGLTGEVHDFKQFHLNVVVRE